MPTDLNQGYGEAKSDISSIKTYIEVSKSAKVLKSTAGNSESQGIPDIASGLNTIATQQKRYLRQPPNSFNQILDIEILIIGALVASIAELISFNINDIKNTYLHSVICV